VTLGRWAPAAAAVVVAVVGGVVVLSAADRPTAAARAPAASTENVKQGALSALVSGAGTQFLGESVLLAAIGGIVGVLAGALATVVYAGSKRWVIVIPVEAWTGPIASAVPIGAFAGLMPAVRASRMPPSVVMRTA
jgi:hypothetical protein